MEAALQEAGIRQGYYSGYRRKRKRIQDEVKTEEVPEKLIEFKDRSNAIEQE